MERKSQGLSYLCCLEPPSTTDNQELRNQGPGFHSIQRLQLKPTWSSLAHALSPSPSLLAYRPPFCLFYLLSVRPIHFTAGKEQRSN